MRARAAKAAVALALPALIATAAFARAEIAQKGTLRVITSGKFSPSGLPRRGVAPIEVSVGGKIKTTDASLPPQLKTLRIELNRHGRLDTRGLPVCRAKQIHPASTAQALRACRPALVGRGSFSVDVVLGGQEPYPTRGRLLVFNGGFKGHPALLGQIYSAHPFGQLLRHPLRHPQAKARALRHRSDRHPAAGADQLGPRHRPRTAPLAPLRLQGPPSQLHQRRLPGAQGLPRSALLPCSHHLRLRRRQEAELEPDPQLHGAGVRAERAAARGDAPLSVVGVVPAVAGPFDVGTVVTQVALRVNPRTAEV